MSHSPPNYTDGVPIKIAEKYKPPAILHNLPTRIIQQLSKAEVPVAFEDYNFDLEHKIISKTSEWIHWRAREKSERQERINQRELERVKRLEDEQKQKLNQVSYPSSDEEDEELANEATNTTNNIPREKPFSPTNFNTILMPTQATMQEKSHRRYASNSSNKIDFSFFESDASPFDHLEMKSMNEMEVLAQVLGSTPVEASTLERDNSSESESSEQKDNNNVVVPQEPQVVQATQQFQPSFASYNNYYAAPAQAFYNYPAATNNYGQVNHQNQFLYPQNYAVNYQYVAAPNNNHIIENGTDGKVEVGSNSKNVPSILKELNDELNNSQRRRIRNNSQNSPKEVMEAQPSPIEDDFSKLSLQTQTLATQMGFQREMILRAVERLGDNDKKIVEHLIPLSELIPMGFDEERISEALIKFDNNKDRALDYLIS